jgi:hypothetical protein
MTVLRAGRQKQVLAQIEMEAPLYSPPALAGDALYLATANRLYLIAATHGGPTSRARSRAGVEGAPDARPVSSQVDRRQMAPSG